jgi:Uma2 family endonuclease
MTISGRFTSADLDRLPAIEGIRYEIIDGDLYVSKQPHWHHQYAKGRIEGPLHAWNDRTGRGVTMSEPGLVFSGDDDVVPDLVWVSRQRLREIADRAGHFREAPEIVVEVVSPGTENERRDRVTKLALYARRGAIEYWIVDWQRQVVEIYRRDGDELTLADTLRGDAELTSALLPGFLLPVAQLWPPQL